MMLSILDQEAATKAMIAEERRDAKVEQAKVTAEWLFKRGDAPEDIADAVGFAVDTIRRWLGLMPA